MELHMKRIPGLAIACLCATVAAFAQTPPRFPANDVTDTYWGVTVHDPYRALENVTDPQVVAWMKAQADYARATLDGLKGYAALKARVIELDNAVEARVGTVRRMADGR